MKSYMKLRPKNNWRLSKSDGLRRQEK